MKRLLLIIILTFSLQSWTKADDIREFQIEGMSIGDSLLDYFNEKEIKIIKPLNKKIKYDRANLNDGLKTYDNVQVWFKEGDTNYIIAAIAGNFKFDNNIEACKKKQNEIGKDINNLYPNLKVRDVKAKNQHDKTGKSITYHLAYHFQNGDKFNIQCYKFSKYMKTEYGREDNLKVVIMPKKVSDHYKNAMK